MSVLLTYMLGVFTLPMFALVGVGLHLFFQSGDDEARS